MAKRKKSTEGQYLVEILLIILMKPEAVFGLGFDILDCDVDVLDNVVNGCGDDTDDDNMPFWKKAKKFRNTNIIFLNFFFEFLTNLLLWKDEEEEGASDTAAAIETEDGDNEDNDDDDGNAEDDSADEDSDDDDDDKEEETDDGAVIIDDKPTNEPLSKSAKRSWSWWWFSFLPGNGFIKLKPWNRSNDVGDDGDWNKYFVFDGDEER